MMKQGCGFVGKRKQASGNVKQVPLSSISFFIYFFLTDETEEVKVLD